MGEAADAEMLFATDLAEWLVQQGTPFRQAHAMVGSLVQQSINGNESAVGSKPTYAEICDVVQRAVSSALSVES